MVKSQQKIRNVRLLEMTYLATQIINNCRQVKKPVTFEEVAKPFLPQKTAEEIKAERTAFFKDFSKQRKEKVKHGNNS